MRGLKVFRRMVFADGVEANANEYVFHEPHLDGPRKVRATNAAILLETGQLFIGCSVCSESDQFTRAEGGGKALAYASAKAAHFLKNGKRIPDGLLNVEREPPQIFRDVRELCIQYQIDKFRDMLYDRSLLIAEYEPKAFLYDYIRTDPTQRWK
jgi:hypothetical protein